MKNIAVIVGKPHIADVVLPTILPDHADHHITLVPYWLWGLFRYKAPRGLKASDLPYIGTPHWRPWVRPDMACAFEWKPGRRLSIDVSAFDALRQADEAICLPDPSPVEAHSVAMVLAHASGRSMYDGAYDAFENIGMNQKETPPFPEVRYLPVDDMDSARHAETWTRGLTTHSSEFVDLVRRQCAVRFFNAAFQINSIAILDPLIREINPLYKGGLVSKASLQLLYALSDRHRTTMTQALLMLENWKGTGRHPDVSAGNAATRHRIVENLINAGLLSVSNGGLSLNAAGAAFLMALHKDCRDVDQFARLEAWSLEWPHSRPRIETYLRTFFGKQKRLSGKARI